MRVFAVLFYLMAGLAPVAAGPHIVADLESGRILHQYNALKPWYPASLTKLMTVYVTLEAVKAGEITLSSPVTVSKNAASEPASKMGFKPGTVLTVDNALKMLVVKSANDIAVALGEAVAGSEARFIARMNQAAQKLGMTGTHFENPHGLPAKGQVTNARDMAVLTRALFKEHAAHSSLFKVTAIRHGRQVLRSSNLLLEHYRGATGMKTGFICASGFNLVATARRGGKHVVAVVLGATSSVERAEKTARLLNRGFGALRLTRGKNLDGVSAGGLGPPPKDMRSEICTAEARRARQQEIRDYRIGEGSSALSRVSFVSSEPVRVFTGGAVGEGKLVRFRGAPLPVPRRAAVPDTGDGIGVGKGAALAVLPAARSFLPVPVPLPRP